MARKPFDYSKWDKIELSDDEEDVHPNIDKDSWFRWKHQARLEREAKEAKETKELEEKNALEKARRDDLLKKLQALSVSGEADDVDPEAVKAELRDVEKGIQEREERLDELEKNKKLNVDNIGTVVKDYTFINQREVPDVIPTPSLAGTPSTTMSTPPAKASDASLPPQPAKTEEAKASTTSTASKDKATAKAPAAQEQPSVGPTSEMVEIESYSTFVDTYQDLMEEFSEVSSLEQTKEMLHNKGHILLADHSQSYMLLSCLEDEMNGKHERMKLVARQSQILSHITELATQLGRSPRDVVVPFFRRLQEPEHLKGFLDSVDQFVKRIEKRAVDKRKEMAEARASGEIEDDVEYEELPPEQRLGPGGLDPIEVFKTLPPALQEAFESQNTEALQAALAALPIEDAKHHMQRCIDSGLWVSNA